jgi:hypothetical protein
VKKRADHQHAANEECPAPHNGHGPNGDQLPCLILLVNVEIFSDRLIIKRLEAPIVGSGVLIETNVKGAGRVGGLSPMVRGWL